jgi:hypothetical protein
LFYCTLFHVASRTHSTIPTHLQAASEASQAAWDAGQKDVAKQKSEEAKALKEQAEAADAAAAEKIFNYMNAEGRQPPNTIDLHNLRVCPSIIKLLIHICD